MNLKEIPKEMQTRICRAMMNTWQAIGSDTMAMVQECDGKDSIARAEVIELVCDAGRMGMYGNDKEAYEIFNKLDWKEMQKLGKVAFPYKRYC